MTPLFWLAFVFALIFVFAEVFMPKYYFGAMAVSFAVLAVLSFFGVTNFVVLLFAFLLANMAGLVFFISCYSKKYYRLHHNKPLHLQGEKNKK